MRLTINFGSSTSGTVVENMTRVTRIAAILCVALTACGSADRTESVSSGGRPSTGGVEKGTSPPTGPPSGRSTPPSTGTPGGAPASPSPEESLLKGNRNSKATALGRTCWVEREVALALGELFSTVLVIEGGPTPNEDHAAAVVGRVKALLNSLNTELGSDAGLPISARAFRGRLVAALEEARVVGSELPDRASMARRRDAFDTLSRILNFEAFPGVKEFAAAAREDPTSCPDI